MRISLTPEEREVARAYAGTWWLFLAGGILWLLLGFFILSLRPGSITAVAWPGPTLVALSVLVAWYLLIRGIFGIWSIIKGVVDLVSAFRFRDLKNVLDA